MANIELCLWIVTALAVINSCLLYAMNRNLSMIAMLAQKKSG
jgi:hypothetical protein